MKGTAVYNDVRHVENLKDLLDGSAKLFGDNVIFKVRNNDTHEMDPITYKEFKHMVDSLGTALIERGLKGKKIAVISNNRYEWGIGYFAVANGVGTVVPLDRALPDEELENLLKRSEAECIIFADKYIDVMKDFEKKYGNMKLYICMDEIEEEGKFTTLKTVIRQGEELLNKGDKRFTSAKIDNERMGIMLFTSGTTDAAKAVMLSHKNICSNVMDAACAFKIYPDDVFFSFLPLHHTFECTAGFLFPILQGASIVHCEGLRHIASNMQEFKPTAMISVPLILENIYKKIWDKARKEGKLDKLRKGIAISNFLRKYLRINITKQLFSEVREAFGGKMRIIVSGAAPLSPLVESDLQAMGINIMQGYGLTETSPIISASNDKYRRVGSSGKLFSSIEARIEEPGEDGIGEIAVKGPNVMLGYYGNKEATDSVLKNGWLYTGDLGYFDKDGYLYVTGRQKSVIVQKNGKNIYPEEIETLINRLDYVKESLVFGKETPNGDLDVWAKVVLDKDKIIASLGKDFNEEEFKGKMEREIKQINKTMPVYKYIREVIFTYEEFEKTTTQKIKRQVEINKINAQ